MKIHEYQAKDIISRYGISSPVSYLATTPEQAEKGAEKIGGKVAVKAQVHVGGRGKAGGIKFANAPLEAFTAAKQILGMEIKGIKVSKLMIVEAVNIQKEYYIGLTVDRNTQKIVFMVSREGGIDIEEVALTAPEKIQKVYIDPVLGIKSFQLRRLASALFDEKELRKKVIHILSNMYNLFVSEDCSLAEINPLVLSSNNNIIALDSKINFDDNALERHKYTAEMIDLKEEDADEVEAKEHGLSFIKLDGDIGCIVNGAGLAMATMDIIKLFGGNPANFLDVGGSSNPGKIVKAFELILRNRKIKSILINIFGGITRCDDIAKGLMQAYKSIDINVPVVIRLTGNNEKAALNILKENNFTVFSRLEDAVKVVLKKKVKQVNVL
ncbi:MAG: ADP-forming succinate--CoA ligase subunit beta [Victivallales bacterium]|nr:ADP-forming succinate--CoA ligase subunit beta [Victivallales bacterium]MCF7888755.1 ADP-forming succinate--CoA ligase subunit beta [Victivallales bacterium]